MAIRPYKAAIVTLPAILIAGCIVWFFLPRSAESTPKHSGDAVIADALEAIPTPSDDELMSEPQNVIAAETVDPLERLKISRQSWRRGGLGSKALVTFTLRNRNDYAVKDVELLCAFTSRDGRYATERRRTISDTVEMKSRKRFPPTLIGFVNIRASRAKCSLLTASRA
jgi:hypothetical protein